MYTTAGGVNGDTEDRIHFPICRFADINNWDALDVEDTANHAIQNQGGNLCNWDATAADQILGWYCGIPTLGATSLFGLSSNTDVHTTTYAPGWCTFHVTQRQRNENGIGKNYAFDLLLLDANFTASLYLE